MKYVHAHTYTHIHVYKDTTSGTERVYKYFFSINKKIHVQTIPTYTSLLLFILLKSQ